MSYPVQEPATRARQYREVIDDFSVSMKARLRDNYPRSWAQFWRMWSDEQVIQRQMRMKYLPNPANILVRGE